jgi:predicted PhzF superfamily epimerase YddE/YHI9
MTQTFFIYRVFSGPQANGNIAAVSFCSQQQDPRSLSKELFVNRLPNNAVLSLLSPRTAGEFYVRWFDYHGDIQRCGHGAFAAAAYLHGHNKLVETTAVLHSHVGERFYVGADGSEYTLTLPDYGTPTQNERGQILASLCGATDMISLGGEAGYIALKLGSVAQLARFNPHPHIMQHCENASLIVATQDKKHIYFRYFRCLRDPSHLSNKSKIPLQIDVIEDSATGSAAPCLLSLFSIPSGQKMSVRQLSGRGGEYRCQLNPDHTTLISARVQLIKHN